MENQIFDAQMERLKLVIRKHTATDLAVTFSRPAVGGFRCRPAREDALQLAGHFDARKNVHPEWISRARAMPYDAAARSSRYETDVEATTRKADEEALRRLPSHMLAEELVRRIAVSQGHAFCSECLGNQP